ncbi:DUF6327 family protein [Flavobacterium crassostreae]|uniref:Glutaminyl-tRNA synthetase n=1 Tax=Flavobacterium crassostreae TaxID=1763534 RepID=A0A1B9E5F4_9FLAO|nr:DUF6327 family protein [Flavobacterium crassostreae]OCB77192.1 hypothetical protein LPBF_04095 [Flavobacterium crassostreae]
MTTKKYASYAEIDAQLEILKLEKEISHQRLVLSIQKTKEALQPNQIISNLLGTVKMGFTGSYVSIIKTVISLVIPWIINKKRGR